MRCRMSAQRLSICSQCRSAKVQVFVCLVLLLSPLRQRLIRNLFGLKNNNNNIKIQFPVETIHAAAKEIVLNVNRAFCFDQMNELLERDDQSRHMALLRTRRARCDSLQWHQNLRKQTQLDARRRLQRSSSSPDVSSSCVNGFEFDDGRCYCSQQALDASRDGNGQSGVYFYGDRCEFRFASNSSSDVAANVDDDACRGSHGGVSLLGSCRCNVGRYGEHCRQRCVTLQRLRACAVLNGRLALAERLRDVESLERLVGRFVSEQAFRDMLCVEASRRALCHDGDGGDSDVGLDDNRSRRPTVRLAFVVMLHNTRHTWNGTALADREPSTGLTLVRWLLASLWHERHLFVVHVDARAPSAWYFDVLHFVRSERRYRDNVFVMPRRARVVWSSIDVVQTTLDATRFLLAADRRWDLLINLSGADVALKTPAELQHYFYPRRQLNLVSRMFAVCRLSMLLR
jgi:hypothetical protein